MSVHPAAAAVFPDARIGLEGELRRFDTEPFQQLEQPRWSQGAEAIPRMKEMKSSMVWVARGG